MPTPRNTSGRWSDEELAELERTYAEGVTVQQVVEAFSSRGARLTEATFRKYVQVGLLPRSVRVARTGKRRGSRGLYPCTVIRQIVEVRRLMSQGYTMDEIQRELLFIRGDLEALSRQLDRIYAAVEGVLAERDTEDAVDELASRHLEEARGLGRELVSRLEGIEQRMSMRARMARAVV
ncbi:MAG: hypothetical protein AB8I08_21740 [Sandaracinaceae bacterium]